MPALLVEPGAALGLLGSVGETARLPAAAYEPDELPGEQAPVPAASLRYLAVVAEYARDLVRRGRVLPQLVPEDGEHAARWCPVLTGSDAARFRELAAAMPPVCRAVAEERPSAHVLIEVLAGLADAAVRRALPDRLLGGHRPGRRSPLADRWTVALTGDEPVLPGVTRAEADELAGPLQEWFRSAHRLDSSVRVCFRLIEPAEPAELAELAAGGSGLPAGADPVAQHGGRPASPGTAGGWSSPSSRPRSPALPARAARLGGRDRPGLPASPQEALLAGLGRAARLYPRLEEALRDPGRRRCPSTRPRRSGSSGRSPRSCGRRDSACCCPTGPAGPGWGSS
nr:hypothetical protein GCM10020093_039150 [Planobispora longispora]